MKSKVYLPLLVFLIFITCLLMNTPGYTAQLAASNGGVKVLWDLSHGNRGYNPWYHFDNFRTTMERFGCTVRSTNNLLASGLQTNYDILILTAGATSSNYTTQEANLIYSFVTNGGAVLILGDCSAETTPGRLNPVAQKFGITFRDITIPDIPNFVYTGADVSSHPFFRVPGNEVVWLFSDKWGGMWVQAPAKTIIWDNSQRVIATCEYTNAGCVAAIADMHVFMNSNINMKDNQNFVENIIVWLQGEKAGLVLFSEDFDHDVGNVKWRWRSTDLDTRNGYDYWAVCGNAYGRVHSYYWSLYCAKGSDIAGQKYDNYMKTETYYFPFIPTIGYRDCKISFYLWYDTESGYDYLQMYISPDGGQNWITQGNSAGGSAWRWSGKSNGWEKFTFSFVNCPFFTVKFVFTSDKSVCKEGVYLDDVAVTGIPLSSLSKNSDQPPRVELIEGRIPDNIKAPKSDEKEMNHQAALPLTFSLHQNHPNPFNPVTTISYQLSEATQVELSVFDVNGKEVRRLVQQAQPGGLHRVQWDARDETGQRVASGLYFYRITTPQFTETRRCMLLK